MTRRLWLTLAVLALVFTVPVRTQALSYAQAQQLAIDQTFLSRVQIAVSNAAIAISSEGNGVAFHVQRLTYAVRALADPVSFAKQMAMGIVSDGVDYSQATDTTLQNRVNAVWNAYAGAVP